MPVETHIHPHVAIEPLERRTLFATLPGGFSDSLVADGLEHPVGIDFAPDGRVFVTEQRGTVRVIKGGQLLPEPFVTLDVSSAGERGALGITLDPNFAENGHVYVFHTAKRPVVHNRVSRFTAAGDVAAAGSETVVFDLDPLDAGSFIHNGGAVHFGPDGKLYLSTGENGQASRAQSLENTHGKVLRINPDGSIPTDNPFYNTATGNNRAIWAYGLRNAYTFAIHRQTGRTLINDVGAAAWEEINEGAAGANYGWPRTEGPTTEPGIAAPLYAYRHNAAGDPTQPFGCSITGGTFYDAPTGGNFPDDYRDDYFFVDGCTPRIWRLDPATNTPVQFADQVGPAFNIAAGPDGALYYVEYIQGTVRRITYADAEGAPSITRQPATQRVAGGAPVTFGVEAAGAQPLTYQWRRDGQDIPGANAATYTIAAASAADEAAAFSVVVGNALGSTTSGDARVQLVRDEPPAAEIVSPKEGKLYKAGQVLRFGGRATDAEDGNLPPAAYSWRVEFHHDEHTHPFYPETPGKRSGSVRIPRVGETSANVWYRVHLTVTDSAGLTHTTHRDVRPQTATVTVGATRPGLTVNLDGQPTVTPFNFTGVVGVRRELSAPLVQQLDGGEYRFEGWTGRGGRAEVFSFGTPARGRTYTARYAAAAATA